MEKMKTSDIGVQLIKDFEGCELEAYLCPANVWTIGYGHTGMAARNGNKITKETAEQLLRSDLIQFETEVLRAVKVVLTQGEFDGLVSFTFNLGASALRRSTLLKKLNANDKKGAADEFLRWVYASGRKFEGLVRRRKAERELFLS